MATINACSLSKLNNCYWKNTLILKGKMAEPTQKKMTSFSDSSFEDAGSTEDYSSF